MADALSYVDLLLKEYLVFRGFPSTLEALTRDLGADRGGQYYRPDAFASYVFDDVIPGFRLAELADLLALLRSRLFCHLPGAMTGAVDRVEAAVLKCYLVQCVARGRKDLVGSFFEDRGAALAAPRAAAAGDWVDWFALPHVRSPSRDPRFQAAFGEQWRALARASFRNLVAEAVQRAPLPTVLRFHADRQDRAVLQRRAEELEREVTALRQALASAEELERENTALREALASLAQQQQQQQQAQQQQESGPDALSVSGTGGATAPEGAGASPAAGGAKTQGGTRPQAQQALQEAAAAAAGAVPSAASPAGERSGGGAVAAGGPLVREPPDESLTGLGPWRRQPVLEEVLPRGEGHGSRVCCVAFSAHGTNVATACCEGVVRVWAPPSTLQLPQGGVAPSSPSSSLSGAAAGSGGGGGGGRGGGPGPAAVAGRCAVLSVGGAVQGLAWDRRSDKTLLMAIRGKGIKAWHVDTQRMVAHVSPSEGSVGAPVEVLDIACSPSEPVFCCTVQDPDAALPPRLTLWNSRAFKRLHTFSLPGVGGAPAGCCSCGFTPDGSHIVAGMDDGSLRLLDPSSRRQAALLRVSRSREAVIAAAPLAGSSRNVAALSAGGRLQVWDLAQPSGPLADVQLPPGGAAATVAGAGSHRLAVSPDGCSVLCASLSTAAPLVSLRSSSNVGGSGSGAAGAPTVQSLSCAAALGPVSAVAWHPTANVVLTARSDCAVRVLHLGAESGPLGGA